MTRRVLAPLFALEALQEGPEIVRDLAHELVRSLGILEREPIRAQDQGFGSRRPSGTEKTRRSLRRLLSICPRVDQTGAEDFGPSAVEPSRARRHQ